MKRGFSASTVILVALLLGVLFWVGKVVSPPIKSGHDDHDEHSEESSQKAPPAPNRTGPTPEQAKAHQPPSWTSGPHPVNDNSPREVMPPKSMMKPNGKPPTPKPDEMDAGYFQRHNMGAVEAPKPETKP